MGNDVTTTTLVRTRKSMTFHRRGCSHAMQAASWSWAENRTRAEIEAVCERTGWKACQRCDPLGVWVRPAVSGPRHQQG